MTDHVLGHKPMDHHEAKGRRIIEACDPESRACWRCLGNTKEPCPRSCHGFGRCSECGDTGYTWVACRRCDGTGVEPIDALPPITEEQP